MKYQIPKEIIPQDQRKEINDKILYLIETDTCSENGITQEDIFSSFTGKGKLHNLNFKEYENYYEYSEAKKVEEQGQFFTPHKICQFLVSCVKPSESDLIVDLTMGMGNFFNFCPNEHNVYGTELDFPTYKVAKHLYPDANLSNEDIRLYNPEVKFDIVFGNPPFNLKWSYGKEQYLSQLFYFIKAYDVMNPAGILALIVPSSFLSDDFMDKKMIELVDSKFNFIYQSNLPKNAFKDFGIKSFETKIMFFQKKSEHVKSVKYNNKDIENISINSNIHEQIHEKYIKPVLEEKKKVHAKIILEALAGTSENKDFQYQVKKLLWDIKNSRHTKSKYAKALNYVNEFYTQKCPDNMGYEEWEKIKITPNKVLSYLKRILKNQHLISKDEIRLVKDNYGLRLKAYSKKSKLQLKKYPTIKVSFNEMVLSGLYPFEYQTYRKLLRTKIEKYSKNEIRFKDLNDSHFHYIKDWLTSNYIQDYSSNEKIYLTDKQRNDVAAIIYKKNGILNWEQGSGKTVAGIFWYRYFKSKVKNTIILGPSIAIKLTWIPYLSNYKEDFIFIDSLEKIDSIQPGQIVLISFDMLRKYERHIKRFVKIGNNKFSLLIDESDEMTNHSSKRTKVTRNCFRKVKYKLFTTGTITRNTINEMYSQFEILYNNSINMLCECPEIYKFNHKDGKMESHVNSYYMKPFPAFYGNGLFKSCFCPFKQTVFGIKKHNQDVYNNEHLVKLIEKTVITRSFFDITGKKPQFEIRRIEQNSSEEFVYDIIINEFYKMVSYYKKTGNTRKDSLLKIIRQIQMLIKATSVPQFFKEYNSTKVPGKQLDIFEQVGEHPNEKIAIGTIFKPSVNLYYQKVKELYPNRPTFLIKGDVPFKNRKLILKEFEETENGILVCTQQSLKSSVNVPTCDNVFIESLQWNIPKLSQFWMRFIRFNSKVENKKITFFVYKNSIEMNLLALLFDKQRLNEFIKTLDFSDRNSIFKEYGIDFSLIDMVMEKVEEDKKVKIAWGKQKII